MDNKSLNKILDLIKEEIIPMTKEGIKLGNKIFGAAIIKKTDLFGRGHKYKKVDIDNNFPEYLIKNYEKFKKFII